MESTLKMLIMIEEKYEELNINNNTLKNGFAFRLIKKY